MNNINIKNMNNLPFQGKSKEIRNTVQQIIVDSKVCEFLDQLSNSTTEIVCDFLANKTTRLPTRDSKNQLFLYNNLILARTNGTTAYNLEQNLSSFEDLECVPKFIKYFELGENDFLTVLGVNAKKLLLYTENSTRISSKTKQDFKDSITEINNRGAVNKEIFANKNCLLLDENCTKIFFADWSEVFHHSTPKAYNTIIQNFKL